MARTPAPARTFRDVRLDRRVPLLLACAIFFAGSGCVRLPIHFHRKAPPIPWETVTVVRPGLPEKAAPPAGAEPLPDLEAYLPPPAQLDFLHSSEPPRPRVAAAAVATPVETPVIAPQLTAEEADIAQRQTRQSLYIAERNLNRTRGRGFSAMQADMAEKVHSFISQAREAANEGDWVRARNLAEKAKVLSKELVRSL